MALSVFPERMDRITVEDPTKSLQTLEAYINYMVERIEFSLSNTFKTTNGQGTTIEGLVLLLSALSNSLSEVTAKVNLLQAAVTGIQGNLKGSKSWFATSSTAAGTAAKVATTATGDFVLATGAMVRVKFDNANSYNGTATLNVDGTGAVDIVRVGTTKTTRYYWSAGETIDFVYDGTNFAMSRTGTSSTTYYGLTKLATSGTSTSTSTSLTPASLNNLALNMLTGIAVYSSSATYAVGDRCRYGYLIYECNTPINTPESWTAAHWTALDPLLDMIEDNDSRLDTIEAVLTSAGPICYSQPQDVTVAVGESFTMSVKVLGNVTYKWEHYYSSSWIEPGWSGHDTDTMTVPSSSVTNILNGRQIRCTIKSGQWTIYSRIATVHVTS